MQQGVRGVTTVRVLPLVSGLMLITVGAESLTTYDECDAAPAWLPDASAMSGSGFFAILTVGIVLAEAGRGLSRPTHRGT